jgi:hypothetical protein
MPYLYLVSKVGQRVGAILGAKDGQIDFLGWGLYEGDHVPPEPIGMMKLMGESWEEVYRYGEETWGLTVEQCQEKLPLKNPRIRLDSGHVVWGAECWWGSEEKVKKQLQLGQVNEIDPAQVDGLLASKY